MAPLSSEQNARWPESFISGSATSLYCAAVAAGNRIHITAVFSGCEISERVHSIVPWPFPINPARLHA